MSQDSDRRPAPDRGLEVEDVSIRYGETTALDRLSLEVATGETLAVLGPSGSGKSTLLRAVAGLEPLAGGRIVLGGRDLAGVATHRRGLGLMFQDHGLFTHLDVADNVAYGLKIAGTAKPDRQRRVAELLDLVGLGGFGTRRTDQLSGGEAQRVALARALAPEPGLLMLDEPLGSLDRALRDQLTGDLRRLLAELGQTTIHVTHDQAEAFAIADRVAILAGGRLKALGTPAELWSDPGTRFVAEFLGHQNLLDVSIERDGSGCGVVVLAGRRIDLVEPDHPLHTASDHELVVLPATAITVTGPGADTIGATVEESVFVRGSSDLTVVVDGGSAHPPTRLRCSVARPVSPGERVGLTIDGAALRPVAEA